MSRKFLPAFFLSSVLFAQLPPMTGGFTVNGEVRAPKAVDLNHYFIELYDSQSRMPTGRAMLNRDGSFRIDNTQPGTYAIRVVTSPGADPLLEEYRQINGTGSLLALELPERAAVRPISGVVSLRELQHPVSPKAVHAAAEAQRYSDAHDTAKAIAKLEAAIRIDPDYRDAHTNLGVQYMRAGRVAEGMAQFQKALEIGPPNVIVWSNLALGYTLMGQYRDAEVSARKAVALDSGNAKAQQLLTYALAH